MSIRTLFVVFLSLLFLSPVFADEAREEALADKAVIAAFMASLVARKFHKFDYAYAVFSTIGKGGFGIGAAHGSGRVYLDGKKTGDVSMAQLSIGF